MKTLAIIHCLFYNYNVLFTDVDIIFYKNPLLYLDYEYDMNIQMESYDQIKQINSGFMYIEYPHSETFIDSFNPLFSLLTASLQHGTSTMSLCLVSKLP